MSAKGDRIVRKIADTIQNSNRRKTQPYDTQATVRRIENGVAWVHIPGGVDETPVRMTINAQPGDTVQVRVSGGRAHLTGNATAPPTDDTTAKEASKTALNYIVDMVDGIFVHPKNNKKNGVRITDVVDIIRNGVTVARYGDVATIGRTDGTSSFFRVKSDALEGRSKSGDAYFRAEDLEGKEITLERTGTGAQRQWAVMYADTDITPTVTVDGVEKEAEFVTSGGNTFVRIGFPYPAQGAVILITYTLTSGSSLPCFTFGTRNSGQASGPYSAVIGRDGIATQEGAVSTGVGTIANRDGQAVVGTYNDPDASQLFAVGNGTSDSNRSTAFAIGGNGEIMTNGQELFGGGSWSPSSSYPSIASGSWSAALSDKTFTLPAGTYLVVFGADFASNATGYRMIQFATSAAGNRYTPTARAVDGNDTRLSGSMIITPTQSTIYSMFAYQNSGGSLQVVPWCNIIRLK